jgi:hypothetical protein
MAVVDDHLIFAVFEPLPEEARSVTMVFLPAADLCGVLL